MWLLNQLEPSSALYNITTALRLTGELDARALQLAFDTLVMRHESLRTILVYENNVLQQCCLPALKVVIEHASASAGTSEEVSRFLLQQYHQSFDLSRAPLLRCGLLRLASDRHVLAITLHHMISDGWSAEILARELSGAYNAFRKGEPPSAPELQIQYADYAEWQRSEETAAAMAPQLEYWTRQLQGVEPLLLPHDRPRPSRQSFRGRTLYFKVPEALASQITALSRKLNSTPFMTLLSAFYVLLHRYSGQTDLAVGSPVSGRNRLELEPLMGFFVNTLVLRAKLEPDASFADLLRQVRDLVLEAQSNQEIPFDRIVEHLQPERDLSHAPLFQVMFAYQELQADAWKLDGLDTRRQQIAFDTAKFDVTLSLTRVNGLIEGALEYSTDLFDAATIERWCEHYIRLLGEIAADAHHAIRDYSLLAPGERQQLLSGWGRPWRTYEVEHGCIHEAFEAQAVRTPHARALTFEHKHVSYGLLNSRANQLAAYTERVLDATRPTGEDSRRLIGICLPPCDELGVAILAVLKSGCGYVPIDPSASPERMRFYAEDSALSLVITDAERGSVFSAFGVDAICVDIEHPFIATMPETNPRRRAAADDLAYVIYTSGSTGKPKGVMVTHRNVMRLFAATDEWFGFASDDVWTLFHSASFDFSVWELWGALLHGGRLVVVPHLTSRSPEAFLQLLKAEQVTVLNQTPSAFKQLMAADEAEPSHSPASLRYVIFGGEALDPSSLQGWISRHGDCTPQLINMYGITETTVHVTYRRITREDAKVPGASPIGVPLPDLRLYVLDAQMNPVPVGVTGEIYVGGGGVARGYLNRDELTRERFVMVAPPLEAAPGKPEAQRLYRTGDLARYLPDGSIEYQGRSDEQVKIRGFRIELGEIEAALRENPGVRAAVVSAIRDAGKGETRLVAHLVPHSRELKVEELRAHLKVRLPEYMIPSGFMFLDVLPLTSNGKVDRKALLALSSERPNLASAYAAPRDDVERTFVNIWGAVLDLSRVGIFDNFFALGGDSLRAVQVISRAREQGLHLNLALLFENQTIAELAKAASAQGHAESAGTVPSGAFSLISPEDRAQLPETAIDAYPLSRMQGGMFYHMLLAPESNVYHCTGTAHLRVKGKFDEAAFRAAVGQTVARHDVLRTSFDLNGFSQPLQIVHRAAELPVVVEDLRHLSRTQQDDRVRALLESERSTPFDLSRPTLLRFFVHLRSEETLQFSMTECHPIFDGWSYHTMIVEVFNRYSGLTGRGRYIEPPPFETCYRDFVAMEQASVDNPRHRQFWLDSLADCTVLRLPRMPGMKQDATGAPRLRAVRLALPDDVYDGLLQLMRAASVPMKSVLLAAHVKVMSLVSGATDILTGIPTNGRPERTGGDQLYGLFLNTLPFRYQLRQESWLELAQAVFAGERECVAYRRYPLAEIQRQAGRQQLVDEVLFNYMDFHVYQDLDRALGFEVVDKIATAEVHEGTHFALTVHFQHLTLSSELRAKRISMQIDFDANRLTQEQVDEIGTYYRNVLAAMARRPEAQHHQQCFLAAPVYDRIVHQLSRSNRGYRGNATLAQLFSQQAQRTADAVAVIAGESAISYRVLNAGANRLAHDLIALGVKAGERVGVYLGRCADFVIAVLAAIKAEAVYVPMEVEDPSERTAFLLSDSGCRFVLTHMQHLPKLPLQLAQPVVLDSVAARIAAQPAHDPPVTVSNDHPACIMFTSGSTGQPKGAVIRQKGVARLVKDVTYVDLQKNNRILQLSALGFDAVTFELWGALLNGGALVLSPGKVPTLTALQTLNARHGISTLFLTASLFNTVVDENPQALRGVAHVLVGGEAMSAAHARKCKEQLPALRLSNAYGPTENTTFSAVFDCEFDAAGWPENIPIGRPIENTTSYVLDVYGQPAPVGTPGELYLGGDGVAIEYLNRDELTRERFIDHPFQPGAGGKLYRTGDIVRYLPDGNIQYLRRADEQLKMRGFRIEPGEIAVRLSGHPRIREAAVLAREDRPGEKRLVAYYTEEKTADGPAQPVLTEQLRSYLSALLPEYMVPDAYVRMEALPLTTSGKLNRQALPASGAAAYPVRTYEKPQGEIEATLARVWAQVLRVERVGRHDHFFELGGHSLLAVRVLSRLRQALGVDVDVAQLLARPALSDFAESVKNAARSTLPPITAGERGKLSPLSFAQQRLWFLAQMEGVSQAYHISLGLRFIGELDRVALKRALDRIVARHEALRTTFVIVDGEPMQQVGAASSGIQLQEIDLTSHADAQDELRRIMAVEALEDFDLTTGPLIRGRLIRLDAGEHVLLVCQHHIVADGWSVGVLIDELNQLYAAFRAGADDPLPPLAIQYSDYVAWQRRWLSGALLKEQSAYWQRTLAGAPELLELPTDRPRLSRQDHAGAVISLELDEPLTNQLRAFSQRLGATMFMTVLAAWSTVLARLSSQRDVVIGAPVANRTRAEVEPLIGYFVNAVALRLDLSGNPSLREVLQRVKTRAMEAQQHQELPFEQVVELVKPVRSLAHTPVFQVMFAWQHQGLDALQLPGLKTEPVGAPYEKAKFDLTLSLLDSGSRICGGLEYATALFERSTVERHVGYLMHVLRAMVSDDQARIDQIDLLSATERQRILKEWTATHAHFPRGQCVHELFEAQAGRNARAVAVVHAERQLNYQELNARANRLAHHLIHLGVEPNDRVAIWLDRSMDLVIAELAILKCGAVYVPLERQAPAERIAALVKDCAARLVLTHSSTEELAIGPSRRVNLDELRLARQRAHDPMVPRSSEAAACVLYTSGSTGRPKGVLVPHLAIGNLVLNERLVRFEAGDRVACASNPAFDASTLEVWGPLLNGGCVVVIDYETVLAAQRLGEVLHSQAVDVLYMSVGLFNQYVDVLAEAFSRLRYLLVGGDVFDPRAAEVLQENPPRHLLNVYGPTEATTVATTFDLSGLQPGARSVPIGRPVANAQIYILDAYGQPVPTGVQGEIHIGGAGVALGYLERPELTEAKFVSDPFSLQAKARLYKTGDLGRYRSDGNIEFLGRNDQQVKLRGFRIEPGEIEACLGEHPRISQACVVVREDRPGEKQLVAYYSVRDAAAEAPLESSVDVEDLKAHVAARLPQYMVPAVCLQLSQLPLNANGKVDRARLPAPPTQTQHKARAVVPANSLEKEIQQVWASVLGVSAPGIHDNFFDLGGHSLSLARVHLQLRAKGHEQLAIVDLFRFPTIHALGRFLSGESGDQGSASRAQVEKQTRDGRKRLSNLQRKRQNA